MREYTFDIFVFYNTFYFSNLIMNEYTMYCFIYLFIYMIYLFILDVVLELCVTEILGKHIHVTLITPIYYLLFGSLIMLY